MKRVESRLADVRGIVYQLLAVVALAIGIAVLARNTQSNLERLGVQSGVEFVHQPAGFEINQKLIAFDAAAPIASAITVALLNTLLLCIVSLAGASLIGIGVGLGRLSGSGAMRLLAGAYVEFFRNLPVLLQVFLWYFLVLRLLPAVPESLSLFDVVYLNNRGLFVAAPHAASGVTAGVATLVILVIVLSGALLARLASRVVQDRTGRYLPASLLWLCWLASISAAASVFGLISIEWEVPIRSRFGYEGGYTLTPEFVALAIALSLYNAAYIAEIVRSALRALPKGQVEAAHALGFSRARALRLVLLPQALRMIVPPLATVYQNILKSSALGAAIAYPELASVLLGSVNNIVGQPVVIIGIALIVYLGLSMFIALLMHWYEHRVSRWS